MKKILFKMRGFTPLPLLLAALIWEHATLWMLIPGAALCILGELLRIRSVWFAGGATRTRDVGAPRLVTSGPYAVVRNPLYLGNMMIYTGYALASGAWFPWLPILGFLFFAFQYAMIISLEEKELKWLYGEEYLEYCIQVPRLFPRLRALKSDVKPAYKLSQALSNERRTLQALAITWILLLLKIYLSIS